MFAILSDAAASTNHSLPIADMGCGTGIQTEFLANHFPLVLGLDVSPTVIQIAQNRKTASNITFLEFNALKYQEAIQLHQKHGDINVYLRGVLHFIPLEHRAAFLDSIQILLGQKGKLYIIETLPEMKNYILGLAKSFSKLPLRIKLALKSNLPPIGVTPQEIETHFEPSPFQIIHSSPAEISTNLKIEGKGNIAFPSFQMILANNSSRQYTLPNNNPN